MVFKNYILFLVLFLVVEGFCMMPEPDSVTSGYSSKNNSDSSVEFPIEILGVTVVPHYVSGEIQNYGDEEKHLSKFNPGALIRIFVKNADPEKSVNPEILFNGKSGRELLDSNVVSYCDVPDIRESATKLSTEIPAGAIDCYLLNVVDSNFYSDGIILKITDKYTGNTISKKIEIQAADLFASRIVFTSSDGSLFPDGFLFYFNNDSQQEASIENVTLWKSSGKVSEHWWSEKIVQKDVEWFGEEHKVPAGSMNGASVNTGKLPFGEIVVEFEIKVGSVSRKMFYTVKPMLINFDIGMGWGDNYLANSEAFCKTIKFMHFNTVNGSAKAFLSDRVLSAKYPMKRFSKLEDLATSTDENELKSIHGSEFFGEPQFDKRPAQEIFNFYTSFRNSGFPSTLTLSHEPGFFLYAGVVDFPHFDAYRVVAPHADRWGNYNKYKEKNVKWGAPLETIGDYMRTLNRISYPNPVAAWTQAMSDGWKSRFRPGAGNPNDLEMRIQAYEAVANGAISLYWFNMGGKTLLNNRKSLAEIQRINRELMVIGDLLVRAQPYWWENTFMNIDKNVLAGPDYAVLFAIDLKYTVSESNQFIPAGKRSESLIFKIPQYLDKCNSALKVTHEGIYKVNVKVTKGIALITDTFETTGTYILYNGGDSNFQHLLNLKYNKTLSDDASYKFDPINSNSDFNVLTDEVNNKAASQSNSAEKIKTISADVWVTTKDMTKKLSKEANLVFTIRKENETKLPVIEVIPSISYQKVDGMGSSFEPATCFNLSQLPAEERNKTLRALLSKDDGIGMNLMRICIGTPDFTGDPWYSYDDIEKGETDTLLVHFSIEKDMKYIIPVLKEALKINPELRFFASPWSPPAWMKTSGSMIGGSLKPEYYEVYANYFVKYLQAYKSEGIPVYAVTIQNEPGVDRQHDSQKWWYPSCHWTAEQEKDFIKNHLGPALKTAGLKTEIWCYDHNYNIKAVTNGSPVFIPERPGDAGIGYPRSILQDFVARMYTDAIAFHGYVGTPAGMTEIHKEFPNVPVRFTEGSVFGLQGGVKLIQLLRNYVSSYNAWVTMLDENRKPNNGAFTASRTIIERNTKTNEVSYYFDYYLYGQFMKFINRGSVRIESKGDAEMQHVAFRDPDNKIVLTIINNNAANQPVTILCEGMGTTFEMTGNSIATLKW